MKFFEETLTPISQKTFHNHQEANKEDVGESFFKYQERTLPKDKKGNAYTGIKRHIPQK